MLDGISITKGGTVIEKESFCEVKLVVEAAALQCKYYELSKPQNFLYRMLHLRNIYGIRKLLAATNTSHPPLR
jgi:hypothetical protein